MKQVWVVVSANTAVIKFTTDQASEVFTFMCLAVRGATPLQEIRGESEIDHMGGRKTSQG